MYQRVIIVGNLGGDPAMRYTQDGTPVTSFSVATSQKWDGNERTTWWRVTAWKKLAETCNEYLAKGSKVLVEGQMQPDEHGGPRIWTGQDGTPRASFELRADTVKFLSSRTDKAESSDTPAYDREKDELPF